MAADDQATAASSRPAIGTHVPRLGHQAAFDGLRAGAVLAVFAFHVGKLPGGWLGVDVFFVLSGFLITQLLLEERATYGSLSLRRFYARRALRLGPALLVMLVALNLFTVVMGYSVGHVALASIFTLAYVANWAQVVGQNLGPLGHTWTLAIEEQFYLLWPLALLVMGASRGTTAPRRTSLRVIGWALGLGAAMVLCSVSLLLSVRDWHDQVYYGLETQGAALLMGCAAAGYFSLHGCKVTSQRLLNEWTMALLALLIVVACVVTPQVDKISLGAVIPLLSAAVAVFVLGLTAYRGWIWRLLTLRPVAYVGRISYALYLWGLPVIWATNAAQLDLTTVPREATQLLLPFALAIATYHLVERPLGRFKHQLGRREPAPAVLPARAPR